MSGEILSSRTTNAPILDSSEILDYATTTASTIPTFGTFYTTIITDTTPITTSTKSPVISHIKPMSNLISITTAMLSTIIIPTVFEINKISELTSTQSTTILSTTSDLLNLETTHKGFILHKKYQHYESFTGLCEAKTCGVHGECEVVNQTHVLCSCRDYYIGLMCEDCMSIIFCNNKILIF